MSHQTPAKQRVLLFIAAVLWHVAFLFSDFFGWLILMVCLPLLPIFLQQQGKRLLFLRGLFFGFLLYAPHFYWFLILLLYKSQAGWALSFCLYSIVVGWFAVLTAVWFLCTGIICSFVKTVKAVCSLLYLTALLYVVGIDQQAFFPLGRGDGYPFVNPLICLVQYSPIMCFAQSVVQFFWGIQPAQSAPLSKGLVLMHLQPGQNDERLSPEQQTKDLILQIKKVSCAVAPQKTFLFVAPESSLPFVLDRHPMAIDLLKKGLPKNAELLVGSLSLQGDRNKQTIYKVRPGLITQIYDKRHLIFGVETISTAFEKLRWIEQPFLKGRRQFVGGKKDCFNAPIFLTKKNRFIPIICSELFFMPLKTFYKAGSDSAWFIFFINDSWFNTYLNTIMMRLVALKSTLLQRSILVVGHKKIKLFATAFN